MPSHTTAPTSPSPPPHKANNPKTKVKKKEELTEKTPPAYVPPSPQSQSSRHSPCRCAPGTWGRQSWAGWWRTGPGCGWAWSSCRVRAWRWGDYVEVGVVVSYLFVCEWSLYGLGWVGRDLGRNRLEFVSWWSSCGVWWCGWRWTEVVMSSLVMGSRWVCAGAFGGRKGLVVYWSAAA